MKRRRILQSMLSGDRASTSVGFGAASDLDFDFGVLSVSLDGTVGGLRPLSLRVGGTPPPIEPPSLDAPVALTPLGDPSIDRIGRGFFAVRAQNAVELTYRTAGLSESEGVTLTLDLGADYEGSVSLEVLSFRLERSVSGRIGDRFSFSIPSSVAYRGSLLLTATADGIFRLSVRGELESEMGASLTLLSFGESGEDLTDSKILLPTPLYALASGLENALYVSEEREHVAVGSAALSFDAPLSLRAGTEESLCPAFETPVFRQGRGDAAPLCTHGAVGTDDLGVLNGEREGFSLCSDDRERLVLALSRQRLADGVLSLAARRLDSFTFASPSSPAVYQFHPYGGQYYYVDGLDGELLSFKLDEPLRCVGSYVDRLYFSSPRRLALRVTQVSCLSLTGDEAMAFWQEDGRARVRVPFDGGQRITTPLDASGLCTHGVCSPDAASPSLVPTEDMTYCFWSHSLEISLRSSLSIAESETAFRSFLRECHASKRPVRFYFPLAEPRLRAISLSEFGGYVGALEPGAVLDAETASLDEEGALLALARLWILGQSPAVRLLYPLAAPYFAPLLGMEGELRLPSGHATVTVVGDVKPISLSLSACVYPGGSAPSTIDAAGSEYIEAPQKGTE